MTVPEKRHDMRSNDPKTGGKRLTGKGLSPAVEKMFGALVDEQDAAGTESSPELETLRASRPGAA